MYTGSYYVGPGVREFVDDFCNKMDDEKQYHQMTDTFRGMVESPDSVLRPAYLRWPTSYRYVKASLRDEDCKDVFCQQLSDQLVYCNECAGRPVLHIVQKDEASMKQHLRNHKNETDDHIDLYKRLRFALD